MRLLVRLLAIVGSLLITQVGAVVPISLAHSEAVGIDLPTATGRAMVQQSPPSGRGARTDAPPSRPAPTSYIHQVVGPPSSETEFVCLPANPSCGRDPWWVEWNDLQGDRSVQFEFVGPGLVAEERFIEAIWLLWQWPEGKFLLSQAAEHGVSILAVPIGRGAFAGYSSSLRVVAVNTRFAETSTWMVADMLAHELKHAADHRAGLRVKEGSTYEECITAEQYAYQVEQRFLLWLSDRFGGLPTPEMVADQLSREDNALYDNLHTILNAPDVDAQALEDYRRNCVR